MFFTYDEELTIPDGQGGSKKVPSKKGFKLEEVLDFGAITQDDVNELMVRLRQTEIKMVPERVIENKKETIKSVKREMLVTHIITNPSDIQRFLNAVG